VKEVGAEAMVIDKSKIVEEIREKLRKVMDPEIGVNLVDGGFIRSIEVDDEGNVRIGLMLTTPYCPITYVLIASVEEAAKTVKGVKNVNVEIVGFGIPPELERIMEEKYREMLATLEEEEET